MVATGQEALEPWPASYSCLSGTEWSFGPYSLRPIQFEDRVAIREWRNAQIEVLRQTYPLTVEDQSSYFAEVVRPQLSEERPAQVLMTLWFDGCLIGYGGLVHINWDNERAEVSFLLDTGRASQSSYSDDFRAFLAMISEVAFEDLGLHRLTTETIVERDRHLKILEASGFMLEGRMIDHRKTDSGFADSVLHARLRDADS